MWQESVFLWGKSRVGDVTVLRTAWYADYLGAALEPGIALLKDAWTKTVSWLISCVIVNFQFISHVKQRIWITKKQ